MNSYLMAWPCGPEPRNAHGSARTVFWKRSAALAVRLPHKARSEISDLYSGRGNRMIEVWGRKNSFNVQKVLWCCEELEVAYERYDAGGLYGVTDRDDYLARNPTGLVPTIADGDLTLWESNTIVRYLSASYGAGSLWPEDPAERALADKWMDYQLGTLFPAFRGVLLGLVRTAPEQRDPENIRASARATAAVLPVLDA